MFPLIMQHSDYLMLSLSWAFSNVITPMHCENYYISVAQLGEWIISNQFFKRELCCDNGTEGESGKTLRAGLLRFSPLINCEDDVNPRVGACPLINLISASSTARVPANFSPHKLDSS